VVLHVAIDLELTGRQALDIGPWEVAPSPIKPTTHPCLGTLQNESPSLLRSITLPVSVSLPSEFTFTSRNSTSQSQAAEHVSAPQNAQNDPFTNNTMRDNSEVQTIPCFIAYIQIQSTSHHLTFAQPQPPTHLHQTRSQIPTFHTTNKAFVCRILPLSPKLTCS
jgi:hypothetical protein